MCNNIEGLWERSLIDTKDESLDMRFFLFLKKKKIFFIKLEVTPPNMH